jgi:hypothetical protein
LIPSLALAAVLAVAAASLSWSFEGTEMRSGRVVAFEMAETHAASRRVAHVAMDGRTVTVAAPVGHCSVGDAVLLTRSRLWWGGASWSARSCADAP